MKEMKEPPKVVLTHWVHGEVLDFLEEHCRVAANQSRETLPREEVLRRAADARGLMAFMPDRVDQAFLAACPGLEVVGGALKGYDNFDVEAMTQRGVWFSNVPDLLTIPTAELGVGLLLALTRRILEGDRWVRSGGFAGWRPRFYGLGLTGATVGIIGMGKVGRALARRLTGWEVHIVYHDPHPLSRAEERALGAEPLPLTAIWEACDIIFPLTHLIESTEHLVDGRALGRMKEGAILVNIGRGGCVDEEAILRALETGRLGGYAADVFEMEDWARPGRPQGIAPGLLNHPRTVFTPHLGSAVDGVRREIALTAARNIVAALRGEVPPNAVNRVGKKRQALAVAL